MTHLTALFCFLKRNRLTFKKKKILAKVVLTKLLNVGRIMMLQQEKEQQSEQHEENVMKLQAKHETDISHLHQEHALTASKVCITAACPPHKCRAH